jgi:hypothetical protein
MTRHDTVRHELVPGRAALPGGFHESAWEGLLVASLVIEAAYLVVWWWTFAVAPSRSPARR